MRALRTWLALSTFVAIQVVLADESDTVPQLRSPAQRQAESRPAKLGERVVEPAQVEPTNVEHPKPERPQLEHPMLDALSAKRPAPAQHHASGKTRPMRVLGDGGPLQVDTPDGPILIRQVQRNVAGGDPFPGCLVCHGDIENVTINMMGMDLDCTACHGGDAFATTKEEAHVHPNGNVIYDNTVPPLDDDLEYQQFVNPSNLRIAHLTCGTCHPEEAANVTKSMMATAAGHYAGGLYQNGVVDTKTPIYGTFAVSDDDGEVPYEEGAVDSLLDLIIYSGGDQSKFSTHFAAVPSQGCARCHLWSRGKGYRGAAGADGVYRADGCAACHMPYANDGLSHSADASIDHAEPGHPIQHVITKQVPTEQCLHCHHRGARIGLSYTGRAQMPPRLPSGPGVPGTTDEIFNGNYHYAVDDTNPPDIHAELGMQCIDCHVKSEIMGDGNIYGHMDQATKIECRTCHGTRAAGPTLLDNDGVPLPNVSADNENGIILTSKVTGAKHPVPLAVDAVANNPDAACAMNGNHLKAEGGLECYSCHSAWVPNCFGCHFERNEQELGLNLMTREYEVGKVRTNNKIFETLRPFAMGPNSEGRIAPYIVGCQPMADVTGPNGEKILDFAMPVTSNGLSGLALQPVNPHTVRGVGEVRTCAECHRAPPSLGFGTGNYAIARQRVFTAGATGVELFDRDTNPALPLLDGSLPIAGPVHAVASRPDVIEGTAEFLFVARGVEGVAIFDRRPGGPADPVASITGPSAIDVAYAGGVLYVVDAGVGVRIYDATVPASPVLLDTVPAPTAMRVAPWGIHLLVAAGKAGLIIANVADPTLPFIEGMLLDIEAADLLPYAHYQSGSDFAVRVYVADPGYGVRIVDLLPDYDEPMLVGGLPLAGAVGLDAYTRYVVAGKGEPSREHDYLYVAAGTKGLHIFDMTDPGDIEPVATVTDLGGVVADVDVSSELAPPGVDDYAMVANETLGLQTVDVNDPTAPVITGTVRDSAGVTRVLVEVQQLDRFLDEHGVPLKENSHPFTGVFSRDDIVRILSASIDCDTVPCPTDIDGDGKVGVDDLVAIILAWGSSNPVADVNGDGVVDVDDLTEMLGSWGECG